MHKRKKTAVHETLTMTYMAVKLNFQQVLLKTLIPTINTLKDMAVLNIIKTEIKMYRLIHHIKTNQKVKSSQNNMHNIWFQLSIKQQLFNFPYNSENYYISANKLTSENFDHSSSFLWIENGDSHTKNPQKGIFNIWIQ